MDGLLNLFLCWLNDGLMLGMIFAGMLLLRPVMVRVFSPQQRAVVWTLGWILGYMPFRNLPALLPVTFLDLVTSRGNLTWNIPSYLPMDYRGDGPYHLALPGGILVKIQLWEWLLWLLLAIQIAGVVVMIVCCVHQTRKLRGSAKWVLDPKDPLLKDFDWQIKEASSVYLCSGLPTSCVRRGMGGFDEIYLQEELPPERLDLVLLHEVKHIKMLHTYWKLMASFTLVLFWWNPVIWLAFRMFCRDLELACDSAVLKELEPERRRDYARTLVELGSGRQLWAVPMSFGECDGALRVKAAVAWKKRPWWIQLFTWLAAVALIAFFVGVHYKMPPAQDMVLAWERETGSAQQLLEDLGQEMADKEPNTATADGDSFYLTELWEAPAEYPWSYLWARGEDGRWYYIRYAWWGQTSDWVGVSDYQETEPPDLTECRKLI